MKKKTVVTGFLLTAGMLLANSAQAISITNWTGVGSFGTSGADGVVTLSPFGDSQYGWVSTSGGSTPVNHLNLGEETNGSTLTSPLFFATAGDVLQFYFNFVTSDGSAFADYGWAKLLDNSGADAAVLFTARTTTGGDTVPGFGMPDPNATLTPASTPIIGGGPTWSPLGADSGECFDVGCGYTNWIQASYPFPSSGEFALQIGVVNWDDQAFDTGMAFDGATIAGEPIGGAPVPEPGTMVLMATGLVGLTRISRRKKLLY